MKILESILIKTWNDPMISSATFLSGCDTVHEYKDKIKALSKYSKVYVENRQKEYEVAECFLMKYEYFIYLCNHLKERFASVKKVRGDNPLIRAAMFCCNRADKVLLLSFTDKKVAVLYNAGQKVDIRPNNHRARDLRAAERKQEKLNKMICI